MTLQHPEREIEREAEASPLNTLSHDDIMRAQEALQEAWDDNPELPPIHLTDEERFHLIWPVLKAAFCPATTSHKGASE